MSPLGASNLKMMHIDVSKPLLFMTGLWFSALIPVACVESSPESGHSRQAR